ncbi:MAG: DUF6320 domain-containing protein [Christensenella sp.]
MNYCDACDVYVDACLECCPLCGKRLTDTPTENELYPHVMKKRYVDKHSLTMEYLSFATFVVICTCIIVNLVTWDSHPWFLAVAAPVLYSWVLVRIVVLSDVSAGLKTLLQVVTLTAMFLAFDYVGGGIGWSYTFVMPLILGIGISYIDFYSYLHKSYWRENLLYALLLLILGFIPIILYFAGIKMAVAPFVFSTIASILTILGILRFALRQLKSEMQKHFHM